MNRPSPDLKQKQPSVGTFQTPSPQPPAMSLPAKTSGARLGTSSPPPARLSAAEARRAYNQALLMAAQDLRAKRTREQAKTQAEPT